MLSPQQFGDYELRHRTEDFGERKPRHIIEAYHQGNKVGDMDWYGTTGTLHGIFVDPEHGRKGIATAMWNMGQKARPRPKHSPDRTAMGDSWARKVGGKLPRRIYDA